MRLGGVVSFVNSATGVAFPFTTGIRALLLASVIVYDVIVR